MQVFQDIAEAGLFHNVGKKQGADADFHYEGKKPCFCLYHGYIPPFHEEKK
jgi:hypothetical protein